MHTFGLTILLAALSMLGALAIDAYLPSLPAISHAFAASPVVAQQTLSIYVAGFALMMLFYGTLSDAFGRRPVILATLFLNALASLGAVFAPSIGWLIVCRAAQGLTAGAGSVVGRAIVRDRLSGHDAQRVMSHITMVFGLAPAIAPVLGGWLQAHLGWRSVFAFLSCAAALLLAACWRTLPESLPAAHRQAFHPGAILRNYRTALRDRRFVLIVLSFSTGFSGVGVYVGGAANFITEVLRLPATAFGWLFIPLIGGTMLGAAAASRLAGKLDARRQIGAGYAVMLLSAVVNVGYNACFAAALPWAVLPVALFSFGLALISPALSLLALDAFAAMRGLAASVLGFAQMMVFALVSGLVVPLLFGSALRLAAGHAAGILLSYALWRLACRSHAEGAGH